MYSRINTAKQKLNNGDYILGMEVWLRDPRMVELLGQAGFDFLHIEYEHVAHDWEAMETLVRTAELYGMTSLFRTEQCINGQVPVHQIIKALKLGVQILMIPQVDSAATARQAVRAAKFPPLGDRGIATCDRSAPQIPEAASLDIMQYARDLNDQVMVWCIIESPEGVKNIDEILAVEGVDAAGFGHQDYSLHAGISSEAAPDVEAARERVFAAAQRHNKLMWWNAPDPAALMPQFDRGIQIGLLSVDVIQIDLLLRRFVSEVAAGARK